LDNRYQRPDGNLMKDMASKFSDETRRRLAAGWDPRVCTLREYARQNGVSERAIRLWRARFRSGEGPTVPAGTASVPLQAVVNALQIRLEELEAAVDAVRAAVHAARAALDVAPVTDSVPSDKNAQAEANPRHSADVEALRPKPMPAPGTMYWG